MIKTLITTQKVWSGKVLRTLRRVLQMQDVIMNRSYKLFQKMFSEKLIIILL